MTSTVGTSGLVKGRYRDAYSVGDSIVGWGNLVKTLGIVAGVIIALLGFAGAGTLGVGAVIVSLILAMAIGGAFYMFGIMVAAQGQMVLAVLDTAVNTSPLLSLEEKGEVITSLQGSRSAAKPATVSATDVTGANPEPTQCPSCGANVYATAKVCDSCWKPLS